MNFDIVVDTPYLACLKNTFCRLKFGFLDSVQRVFFYRVQV